MRTVLLSLVLMGCLSACSIYQSKGRKYLRSNAYNFAGVSATAHFKRCSAAENTADWQLFEQTDKIVALKMQTDQELHLQIADSSLSRSCLYAFSSEKELEEQLQPAIELTLLHFSLGEFAFRHQIPLK